MATLALRTGTMFVVSRPCVRCSRISPLRRGSSSRSSSSSSSSSSSWTCNVLMQQNGAHICRAQTDSQGEVMLYNPSWTIEPADIAQVMTYRAGLSATVAAFITAAAITHSYTSSDPSASAGGLALLDPLCVVGATGLGLSLAAIRMYVTEIKRVMQALWVLGVVGGVYLAASHPEQPLPLFVAEHAWTVWFVGPAAAALTGIAVKEGLCYGKAEAAGLAVLLPLLCLAHLSGLASDEVQWGLLWTVGAVAAVFAGRKYAQPVKDDVGDKSVFAFKQLSPEEQQVWLRQRQEVEEKQRLLNGQ